MVCLPWWFVLLLVGWLLEDRHRGDAARSTLPGPSLKSFLADCVRRPTVQRSTAHWYGHREPLLRRWPQRLGWLGLSLVPAVLVGVLWVWCPPGR